MKIEIMLALFFLAGISGCGGGGSSSGGGEQSKNVTSCIGVATVPSVAQGFSNNIFTNSCEFTVNLATFFIATISDPIALPPNQEHRSLTASSTNFIACRPPSIGQRVGEFPSSVLECS